MVDLGERLTAAIRTLESAGAGPEVLRELGEVSLAIDVERATHEAVLEQFHAQRELLLALGCPILQVRRDVLCVPLVGPYDMSRAMTLQEAVLAAVVRERARVVVLDLTGAVVPDPASAGHLVDICRAIGLLGARAALSGLSVALAQMLAAHDDGLHGVPAYLSLETAIAAHT